MLSTLTLKNFQAHKDLTLTLDPNVTTLVGPTDTGKTAVIRALKWLVTNRPGGEEFLRDGTKTVSVTLTVNGRSICRTKGKGGNLYLLDGKEFKAFGTEVPGEIQQVLNLAGISFQEQHDGPFWFSLSAGEVSRELNEIINLGSIDSTLSYLNQQIRENNARATLTQERVEEARELKKQLSPVIEIDLALQHVEALQIEALQTAQEAAELHDMLTDVHKHTLTLSNAQSRLEAGEAVIKYGEIWWDLEKLTKSLTSLIDEVTRLSEAANREIPDLSAVETAWTEWRRVDKIHEQLVTDLNELYHYQKHAEECDSHIAQIEQEFAEAMGDRCPLCGQQIGELCQDIHMR